MDRGVSALKQTMLCYVTGWPVANQTHLGSVVHLQVRQRWVTTTFSLRLICLLFCRCQLDLSPVRRFLLFGVPSDPRRLQLAHHKNEVPLFRRRWFAFVYLGQWPRLRLACNQRWVSPIQVRFRKSNFGCKVEVELRWKALVARTCLPSAEILSFSKCLLHLSS